MQDWKDSDLRSLFREMRERDHASAVGFQHDWRAAKSRIAARRGFSFKYLLAVASVILLAVSAVVLIKITRAPSAVPQASGRGPEPGPGSQGVPDRTLSNPVIPDRATPKPAGPHLAGSVRIPGRGQVGGGARRDPKDHDPRDDGQQLISTWRSPTDFLLESSVSDLLRTVPRSEDSLVRLDR